MPVTQIAGAYIRFVNLRYDDKSKRTHVVIKMASALTGALAEKMEWPNSVPAGTEPPVKLSGEIRGIQNIVLTPNGKELASNEIELACEIAEAFQLHVVKTGEDSTESELRFDLVCNQPDAVGLLQGYLNVIGKGHALLKLRHLDQAKLEEQDKEAATNKDKEDDRQQTLPDIREMAPKVRGGRRAASTEVN